MNRPSRTAARKKLALSRYPLVDNAVQAGIMKLAIREGNSVSNGRVIELLGVNRNRVSGETARLIALGLLAEQGFAKSNGGRPSLLFHIPRSAGLIGAVELGATSIDVALTTLTNEVVGWRSESADIKEGPSVILGRVKTLLAELLAEHGAAPDVVLGIGIGAPGPIELSSGLPISPALMPGWDSYPVGDYFAQDYSAPIFVDNEVNLMALAEHRLGVGRGARNMLFVKVGTGIGAGLIINGELFRGEQGSAGQIAHVCVNPIGPLCLCGNHGCLAAMAAAPAIIRDAEACARGGDSPILLDMLKDRETLDAKAVGEAAGQGDPCANAAIRRSGRLIGQTLGSLVCILNPALIIVGGGIARIHDSFLAEIRTAVYQRSPPLASRDLRVILSELGDQAGVIGASILAVERLMTAAADRT